MPWGCVGTSLVGTNSGPGIPNCGIPGTFGKTQGLVPAQMSSQVVPPQAKAVQV